MGALQKLPTLADVQAARAGKPQWKGKTRLQLAEESKRLTTIDEKAFRAAVWKRDGGHCRCCHRRVIKTLARVSDRAEVHHIHGRGKDLRFEVRAALLTCARCHERLTGKVNAKLILVPSQTFTMRGETFTDATFAVVVQELV